MLRLAHRILGLRALKWWRHYSLDPEKLKLVVKVTQANLLAGVPIIIADNVAEYHARHGTLQSTFSQFPPCRPPFNEFFIEFNTPSKVMGVVSEENEGVVLSTKPALMTPKELGVLQTGMLIKSCRKGTKDFNDWYPRFQKLKCLEQANTLLAGLTFETDDEGDVRFAFARGLLLDGDGKYLESATGMAPEWAAGGFSLAVVMLTLAFMQCKNVERIEVTNNEDGGIPLAKWCRRQRVPELKYHTLLIDPNIGTKPRSSERKTEGDRTGKALHICRGYFMHCVNDGVNKGLFGKGIYGTFWVPSHVRGSADLGRVIPTYNVLAPTEQLSA